MVTQKGKWKDAEDDEQQYRREQNKMENETHKFQVWRWRRSGKKLATGSKEAKRPSANSSTSSQVFFAVLLFFIK